MPDWVGRRHIVRRVECGNLRSRQLPAGRAQVFGQLGFVARTDDDGRDGGSLQQVDMRHAEALEATVDRLEKMLSRRAVVIRALARGKSHLSRNESSNVHLNADAVPRAGWGRFR